MVLRLTLRTQGATPLPASGVQGEEAPSWPADALAASEWRRQRSRGLRKTEDQAAVGRGPGGHAGVVATTRGQGSPPQNSQEDSTHNTREMAQSGHGHPQEKGQGRPRSREGRLTRKTRPQRPRTLTSYFKTSQETVKDGASQEVGQGNGNRRKTLQKRRLD